MLKYLLIIGSQRVLDSATKADTIVDLDLTDEGVSQYQIEKTVKLTPVNKEK
jgi:hypothetical protein